RRRPSRLLAFPVVVGILPPPRPATGAHFLAGAGRRRHSPRSVPRLARPIPHRCRGRPEARACGTIPRMGEVRYERVGAAALLTIDRPERRNAVDAATARALRQGFEDFEADEGARALVLTGAGGEAFCAGADLKAMDIDIEHPSGPMGFSRL